MRSPPARLVYNLFLKPVRGAGHGGPMHLSKSRSSDKRGCSRAGCLGPGARKNRGP